MTGPHAWPAVTTAGHPPHSVPSPRRRGILVAALLTCLTAVTACTGTPSDPPATPPPATTPAPSPTPKPTPSPTPVSEREKALADSKQAYIDYWRALDQMAQAGGGDKLPEYVSQQLTANGPARDFYEEEVEALKTGGFRRKGFAELKDLRILNLSSLAAASPTARWHACIDQTEVQVTERGKPFKHPAYLEERVDLRLESRTGAWLVYDFTSRPLPDESGCEGKQ